MTVGSRRPLDAARRFYAEEIKYQAGIRSPAVVRAFASVPRERFLGPGPWQIFADGASPWKTPDGNPKHLYHNVLVSIVPSRHLNNGHPAFLARLIDALDLTAGDRVAHIGCGTGYYSAIMAEVVGKTGSVIAVEIDPKLAARAKRNLSAWRHVTVVAANGSSCELGVVDALLVNAGATHPTTAWLDALAPNGRLIVPLTVQKKVGTGGAIFKVTRRSGGYDAKFVGGVGIFPCAGAREKTANRRLESAFKTGGWQRVKSLRRKPHKRNRTCWLHSQSFCLSRAPLPKAA